MVRSLVIILGHKHLLLAQRSPQGMSRLQRFAPVSMFIIMVAIVVCHAFSPLDTMALAGLLASGKGPDTYMYNINSVLGSFAVLRITRAYGGKFSLLQITRAYGGKFGCITYHS